MRQHREQQPIEQAAGIPVKIWCRAAGISRALFYQLPVEFQPNQTKVGDRRIIFEPARNWLERVAKAGGVPIPRKAA